MQQFYEWFGKLEELVGNEQEEEYKECLLKMTAYLNSCEIILGRIDGALGYLQTLDNQYQVVSTKTGELHQACEESLNEQKRHVDYANAIFNKLTYFNELDKLGATLNTPTISVHDEAFGNVLKRLDQCVAFVSQNSTFQESETYLLKLRQLQNKGLNLIKNKIITELKKETNLVLTQLKVDSMTGKESSSIENAMFNVKFRIIAQKLKPLCRELEARTNTREFAVLLLDVQSCYFQQRQLLLSSTIYSKLQSMIANPAFKLDESIRVSCSYLMDMCFHEYTLYHQFFTTPTPGLRAALENFCRILYDSFRPLFIRERRIDELCTLANILKTDVLADQITRRGESVAAFKPIINRMIEDIQERLIFLSLTHIRDEISGFSPSNDDLNYPQKLLQIRSASGEPVYPFDVQAMESAWYPTLKNTILCLSKLYQTVDSKILEGLAQEAVAECTYSLARASKLIVRSKSALDGQLFLIMHLLILREQIDAITKMLSGQSIWSRDAILGFVTPRIKNLQIDSKKALEQQLREAIEECISNIIQNIASKLITFVTGASSWLNINAGKEGQLLKDQAFAQPDKIAAILDEVKELLKEFLPLTVSKLRLYLSSPTNETNFNNFMNTLKDNILQYFTQLNTLVKQSYSDEEITRLEVKPDGELLSLMHQIFSNTAIMPLEMINSNGTEKTLPVPSANGHHNNNVSEASKEIVV